MKGWKDILDELPTYIGALWFMDEISCQMIAPMMKSRVENKYILITHFDTFGPLPKIDTIVWVHFLGPRGHERMTTNILVFDYAKTIIRL